MKTTVAISQNCRIDVNPSALPGQRDHVVFQLMERTNRGCCNLNCEGQKWENAKAFLLSQDQAGALIFALEQAAEAAQMADRRVAA